MRKTNKPLKPIYLLLLFIAFFGGFFYLIAKPSQLSKAMRQIHASNNTKEIKEIFDHYKYELLETDGEGKTIVNKDFQTAIRTKLNTFNLSEDEIKDCLLWLPETRKHLNLIVIPDLSRRIIDTINNPNQIQNDLAIIHMIWDNFADYAKFNQDVKDILTIDITDGDQANRRFPAIADSLIFDLSLHTGKSNRLYFTQQKQQQLETAINTMYNAAREKPLGADYVSYFKIHLSDRLKKSTLFDSYSNKVIIITDGYLEPQDNISFTKITPQLRKATSYSEIKNLITKYGLNIPFVDVDLSQTDVLVCEVNERKTGKNTDLPILKAYWEDWFERLNAHKIQFITKEHSLTVTGKKINSFLK